MKKNRTQMNKELHHITGETNVLVVCLVQLAESVITCTIQFVWKVQYMIMKVFQTFRIAFQKIQYQKFEKSFGLVTQDNNAMGDSIPVMLRLCFLTLMLTWTSKKFIMNDDDVCFIYVVIKEILGSPEALSAILSRKC